MIFLRRCVPGAFVRENAHQWDILCQLFETRWGDSRPRPLYPFISLFQSLAAEWINPALEIGNIESLPSEPAKEACQEWVQCAMMQQTHSKVCNDIAQLNVQYLRASQICHRTMQVILSEHIGVEPKHILLVIKMRLDPWSRRRCGSY